MKKIAQYPVYYAAVIVLFLIGVVAIMIGATQKDVTPTEKETTRTISFAIYGGSEQRRIIGETVKYFENEYNCEVVIYSFSTLDELQTRVLSQYSAGDPFDIFYVDHQQLIQLKKKIEPLDDVLTKIRQEGVDFIESALDEGRISQTQYALPTGVKPYCIFYNVKALSGKDLVTPQAYLDNKQWDIRDFDTYCRTIYEKTGKPVFAISAEWQSMCSFIIGHGGKVLSEDNLLQLDEKGEEVLLILKDLLDLGAVVSIDNLQWGSDPLTAFRSEAVPMIYGPLDYIYELYESPVVEWDVMPMPMIGTDYTTTLIDVPQIAVAKGENAGLAKEFVHFFVSSYGQKIRLEEGERLMSSLNMAFYTSLGDVKFPDHTNYLFFIAENGKTPSAAGLDTFNDEGLLEQYRKFINMEIPLEDFISVREGTNNES